MKVICVSFTLKGQDFEKIADRLRQLRKNTEWCEQEVLLIHGFMPKEDLIAKGIPTNVIDTLKEIFPLQLNMYREKVLRNEMSEVAKKLDAEILIVGEIKEGVQEEFDLYNSIGLNIFKIPIEDEFQIIKLN